MMARRRKSRSPSDFCFFPPPTPSFCFILYALISLQTHSKDVFFPFPFHFPTNPTPKSKADEKKKETREDLVFR